MKAGQENSTIIQSVLIAAGFAPVLVGQPDLRPRFEVASVKPSAADARLRVSFPPGQAVLLADKNGVGEWNMVEPKQDENIPHATNFLEVVRSRKREDLVAEVHEDEVSTDLVHLANASFRTGRKLNLEPARTRIAADEAANRLLARQPYRAPYVVT